VQTNRTIHHKKPDITARDNEECCYFRRQEWGHEAERIKTYKDLKTEIQCMWTVETTVIPVITRVTGTISRSFRKYLNHVTGKHEIQEIQKTAIFCSARIFRKVPMQNQKLYHGK
jgi:hypothetical protein